MTSSSDNPSLVNRSRRNFFKTAATALAGATILPEFAAGLPLDVPSASFELEEFDVKQLQNGLASGKFSSRQLVDLYSSRIDALDRHGSKLNSIIEMNPEAMAIAEQMDAERKAHGPRGPLHGIPVVIKDNIATADQMQTTAGSLALLGAVPPGDSMVAARLRKAGAVILGKANLSEWANLRSAHSTSGWSGRGGLTLNPYALDRNPSGSSSGTAAAITANLCAIGIGTETDGSIVSPSNNCMLVGMKPTVGLVSRFGIVPISQTQDTAGPMTRTVADAAALLSVLAGVDSRDPATASAGPHIESDYTRFLDPAGLKGARIGVVRQYAGFNMGVDALFNEAVAAVKHAGAEVIDPVQIPTIDKIGEPEIEVLLFEFKDGLNRYLAWLGSSAKVHTMKEVIEFNESHRAEEMPYFGQDLMERSEAKGPLTSPDYLEALKHCRQQSRAEGIDAAMDKFGLDALLAPTGSPAWMTDLVNGDNSGGSSSSLAAVAGYPDITVPMGFVFGLPVGISFFGRAWSEAKLIKLAYAYEQLTKARKPPEFLPAAMLKRPT